jgi:hypothetical protein
MIVLGHIENAFLIAYFNASVNVKCDFLKVVLLCCRAFQLERKHGQAWAAWLPELILTDNQHSIFIYFGVFVKYLFHKYLFLQTTKEMF